MTTECYNVKCPKHGDQKDGPIADCDLVCPEDGLVESAKNTKQQVQPDNSPKMCEECGEYPADSPSKLCCGCATYKEHLS